MVILTRIMGCVGYLARMGEMRNIRTEFYLADLTGHAVSGVGLRPFGCWDRGFESR
jgi:hypothetical protein